VYLLLCYDVVENRRRTRLHKRLLGFLRPVQWSVFEGHLPERRYADLLHMVQREIDPETDSVRICRLCVSCCEGTTHLGTSFAVPDPSEPVVV
jgi:CRISPR-associated protein Cas2